MALPTDEKSLMELRKETIAKIQAKGGKDKAPNYTARLNEIDSALAKIRSTANEAPTPETTTTPGAAPAQTSPAAGNSTIGISTDNLPAGVPSELLEGLTLGKALYPDGSLGELPNPAPIGDLGPFDKVQMVDVDGIPKVSVIDTSKIPTVGAIDPKAIADVKAVDTDNIPQVKELTEAANDGNIKSISQWEDYYDKTQQRDQYIDAALDRAMKMADEGYSGQDMQAKRASANRAIDSETQTALRDMRNSQGSAGNFGGVAAARQKDLLKNSLLNKAMTESDLLAKDADYKLTANQQAGTLANQAYQTYNTAQQAGLTGATNARSTVADEILKRQMSNQDAQGKNQSAFLEGKQQELTADISNQGKDTDIAKANQGAEATNAGNYLTGEQIRGQQEGDNARNIVDVLQGNQTAAGTNAQIQTQRDIQDKNTEVSNADRETETTKANMEQREKEKALQAGTGIGYWEYLDASQREQLLAQIQKQLADATAKGL